MASEVKGSEEGTIRSYITANLNLATGYCRKAFRVLTAWNTRGVLALIAVWIALGAVQATAQTVQFFGSFQAYSQNGAAYAQGLVTDASGNLYVSGAHALVYIPVDANGNPTSNTNVSCSPGNGAVMGMAIDTTNHILFRADLSGPDGEPDVEEVSLIGGSPTNCTLSYIDHGSWTAPSSVAVDASSNLYVLDAETGGGTTGTIYELTPGSGYSKSAVCSSTGLLNTTGLSIDGSGNFYVASTSTSAPGAFTYNYGMESPGMASATGVFKVTGSGGGTCTLTQIDSGLTNPTATAADAAGNIWVADLGANNIYLLMPNGGGGYNQTSFQSISQIRTLTVNSAGKVYGFAYDDFGNFKAQVWTGGTPPHYLGTYQVGTPATTVTVTVDLMSAENVGAYTVSTQGSSTAEFQASNSTCATGSQSALYTCTIQVTFTPQAPGLRTGALVVTDSGGNVLGTNYFYGIGQAPSIAYQPGTSSIPIPGTSGLVAPFGADLDEAGNLYVTDLSTNKLSEFPAGSATATTLDTIPGGLGIKVDGAGNLWVADSADNDIVLETLTGPGTYAKSTPFTGLSGPYDVAVDGSGNVYIAEYNAGDVLKETLNNGSYVQSTVVSGLQNPAGVAVDTSGNVYVSDTGNNRVLEETPSGSSYTQTIVANSGLSSPLGLAIDPNGNVYISDSTNARIVKAKPSGGTFAQSTLLATGMSGPAGLALDAAGDLYIADEYDQQIDELNVSTAPSLTFANTVAGNQSSDSPRTAILFNYGNISLNISSISLPTGFATDPSSICATSFEALAANGTCLLAVDFEPTGAASYNSNVVLTDNNLNGTAVTQNIAVSGTGTAAITISPASGALSAGTVGAAYSQTFTASGGSGSYTFTSSGSIPAGLSLSAGGVLSGTPTTAGGPSSFNVIATDTNNSSQVSQAYTLSIGQGTASVTTWPTAGAIGYGQTLASSTLTGGTASVAGSFAFTTPGTSPSAGAQSESVTFTPTDTADYDTVAGSVSVTVNKATPSVTTWPTAGAISYGQTLASSTLTGGSASVAGSFAFTTPGTSPSAGAQSESVTFTPTDTADYDTVAGSVSVTVNKATPSVTTWPTAGAIGYGQTLASSTLTGGTASVAGSFAFTTPGTSPSAGAQSESVTFTPTDTADYNTVAGSASVTVNKDTATVTLGSLNQTYTGSALTATATTNPAGLSVSFTYNGSSTAPTNAGSYTVVGTINSSNYAGSASGSLVIGASASAVSLTASANPAVLTNPVTLTATVTSTVGAVGGQVSFLDGVTPLGSAAISSGVATFTTSSLAVGSHSITAAYQGITDFAGSSSSALSLTVVDFALSSGGDSGGGSGGSGSSGTGGGGASQTVMPGGSATYQVAITPSSGTSFPTPTTLTVTGLPDGATATLNSSQWTALSATSWQVPANTALGSVSLTFKLPGQTASSHPLPQPAGKIPLLAWGALLLPFARRLRRMGRKLTPMLLLVVSAAAIAGLTGCVSSNGFFGQTQQSYNITVTLTTGSLSHSTNLTLTVQ